MLFILILICLYLNYIVFMFREYLVDDNFNIPIYDNSKNINSNVYNIGDILNIPSFWAGWEKNPHNNDGGYKLYLDSAKQFPNSILYYYSKLRTNNTEPIPNINKLEKAVDLYINNNNLNDLINKVNNINVLCIHLRSGDKGIVENEYIEKINILVNKYNKIIILCGIHTDQRFENYDTSKFNLIKSLQKINKNKNIEIYLDIPDNHLVMMRNAKNLLIHKGGFSTFGSVIFNGDNLYYTELFEAQHNDEIIEHIKNKNINFIKI